MGGVKIKEKQEEKEKILKCPVCNRKMKAAGIRDVDRNPIWFYCETEDGFAGTIIYPSIYGACPIKWISFIPQQIESGEWKKFLPRDIEREMKRVIGLGA